ncbi:hypothetical protein BZZ01_32905 (plasmid) [Nostocales cyanobacterium HT-58-2]|nr:hypothetical protein BZZ01_32905 [Nostocales cyanobacterium HT-58-2]
MNYFFDGINVGQSANLIQGLNSNWNPGEGRLNILYPLPKQSISITSDDIQSEFNQGRWEYPAITLHESLESLLTELIPYEVVNPSSEQNVPNLPAGALVMGGVSNHEAVEELSKTIGVDLSNSDYCYALAKLTRKDGVTTHASVQQGILMHLRLHNPDPRFGITKDFKSAMIKLRHYGKQMLQDYSNNFGVDEATYYLDLFKTYGTHFVSQVDIGDTIMQVFAYPPEKFKRVKDAYANVDQPLTGEDAVNFVYYTSSLKDGEYGFVQEYGHILNLSNSCTFNKTLKEGKWQEPLYAKTNSVFALFDSNAQLTLRDLQERFRDTAPNRVQLTTMTLFVEYERTLIWQRVLSAAFVQKYQFSIDANFTVYDDRDFVAMLPEDHSGVLSTIATPTINVYKTRIDIGEMRFCLPDEVNDFTLFANVLSSSAKEGYVKLPGRNARLFGQVLDMRTSGQPKAVMLNDAAYDEFEIACSEFLGALALRNQAGTKYNVIVDGLKYGLSGEGRNAEPIVIHDVRQTPSTAALPLLVNSLQFSLTFAEAVLSNQTDPDSDIQKFIQDYLLWIVEFIPTETEDAELLALRVRAFDLAKYATDPSYGSFVPILPPEKYANYVQSILDLAEAIQSQISDNEQRIEARRQYEWLYVTLNTLNQNIIDSGKLLTDVIKANTDYQKDITGYYDSIISQQKAEAQQQKNNIGTLERQLFEQQAVVNTAIDRYNTAVQAWQMTQDIKFALDVAKNLFILVPIFTPSSGLEAVKNLGNMAQWTQKNLHVLNTSETLYSSTQTEVDELRELQKELDELKGNPFGNPSTLAWDEMSEDFDYIMNTGPDDPKVNLAKAELQRAFNILVLRGKALTTAKSALHHIQRDIYTNQQQKEINERQAKRLEHINDALNPGKIEELDKSRIDLIGLTGNLVFVQNQILTILAKAFLLRDQALQYANLQPATPITSFSLLKFRWALMNQAQVTVEAESKLRQYQPSITHPIDYTVDGVSTEDIINGNRFSISVDLGAKEFYKYVVARIISVVAEVDGIQSTDSGDYLVQLTYQGTPFNDRNLERQALTFRTPWRERTYQYNAETGTPKFSDGGESWSKDVSNITPFSTWEISLPNTQTNKGITFKKSNLNIKLTFVLEARIVDASFARMNALVLERDGDRLLREMLATTAMASAPSSEDVVKHMFNRPCTNNWDVVFNMSLDQINESLKDQYEELKTSTDYKNVISVTTYRKDDWVEDRCLITKFYMEYGYPLMSFYTNNPTKAHLQMEILSGSIQKCMQDKGEEEICKPRQDISGQTLSANVEIGQVEGTVETETGEHDVLIVQLDMKEGAFDISDIDLSSEESIEFNKAVKEYFVKNPVVFIINKLDLSEVTPLHDLKPNGFYFKPLKTQSSNTEILQLFIQTGNRKLHDYSQTFLSDVPEPIPLGEKCSLMIRSELFFSSVLPQSLNKEGWNLEGVEPESGKAWTAKFTRAIVTADIDLSKLNHEGQVEKTQTSFEYYLPNGKSTEFSLEGMKIELMEEGKMRLEGSRDNEMEYIEKYCHKMVWEQNWKCKISPKFTDVSINVHADMPPKVDGDGRMQTVKIDIEQQAVTVDGRISGGGSCGSRDVEALVNQQIKEQVPPQIVAQLNVSFEPISIFALKNLLFPSKNYINFSSVHVPGDLLLLGTFTNLD